MATDDQTPGPSPEWRSAQHRVRNDMQTLASLLRLSRRRANGESLPDEFALWLNSLAAVYDVLPLWDNGERMPVRRLIDALQNRCDYGAGYRIGTDDGATVKATSSVAVSLAVSSLLAYSCDHTPPGSSISVNISHDTDLVRIETVFPPLASGNAGWPPLSLSMAAQALDARFALGPDTFQPDAGLMVAVVVIPCR